MLELMPNIAPLGFERLSPLVNPLEVTVMPPYGPIRAEPGIGPTMPVAAARLESRHAGARHAQLRHPTPTQAGPEAATEAHTAPNGMALLSAADGRVLLEVQAGGRS